MVEGDFDCDGTLDIVTGIPGDGEVPAQVRITYGVGDGGGTCEDGDPNELALTVADIDGDRCDDLIVTTPATGLASGVSAMLGGASGADNARSLLPVIAPDGQLLDAIFEFVPSEDEYTMARLPSVWTDVGGAVFEYKEISWGCSQRCYDIMGVRICIHCCWDDMWGKRTNYPCTTTAS